MSENSLKIAPKGSMSCLARCASSFKIIFPNYNLLSIGQVAEIFLNFF